MIDEFWQTKVMQTKLTRRSFLWGASSLALAYGLAGCAAPSNLMLRLLVLRGSIPPQLLGEFRKFFSKQMQQSDELRQRINSTTNSVSLKVDSNSQLQELFASLQQWQQAAAKPEPESWVSSLLEGMPFVGDRFDDTIPDLVTLGDYWLTKAIEQKLITPIGTDLLSGWNNLAQMPQLKNLVTRNQQGLLDAKGSVWGVPYRMGTTLIAYRRDIFEQRNLQPPTDWEDLWRPDLKRRIAVLNQPRSVIGFTLKKLGQSYNTEDLSKVPNLNQELNALQQQVLFYSSEAYLQPLLLDDVWVAVGWSTDILPLMQRSRQIASVVPKSGTALWADLWVRPAAGTPSNPVVSAKWIDFLWEKNIAAQLSLSTWAVSPALLNTPLDQLPVGFREHPTLRPDPSILQSSEFLLPVPEKAIAQYQSVWQKLRTSQLV